MPERAGADDERDPWFKFFGRDWQSDESLGLCSMAARGFWMELICLMHRSPRYGYLLGRDGTPPTDADLAILTRSASPREVRRLSEELRRNGVCNRDSAGVYYSRRMVRTAEKSARLRYFGSLGGNPLLRKTSAEIDPSETLEKDKPRLKPMDKPRLKPMDKPRLKPHMPEARSTYPEAKVRGISTDSVQTAAPRRNGKMPTKINGQKTPTHRRLCAIATRAILAHPRLRNPRLDFGEWADVVKRRLVEQGFADPTPHALRAALDAVTTARGLLVL
jgi:hypothetical protein